MTIHTQLGLPASQDVEKAESEMPGLLFILIWRFPLACEPFHRVSKCSRDDAKELSAKCHTQAIHAYPERRQLASDGAFSHQSRPA